MSKVKAITCAAWVPKGAAKQNPDKVEITSEDLARIISETKENVDELDDIDEENYTKLEVEALEEDLKKPQKENIPKNSKNASEETEVEVEEVDDIIKQYNFDAYDDEKDVFDTLSKLGNLTVHASSEEDPLMKEKEDDEESEKDNQQILPTDNLVAVGHVDGDAAVLEVYVYNPSENSFYVHHDYLLPAVPLCLEWLNTDPGEEDLKPANLIAIGSLHPVIEVWDLDLVDALEPAFRLGRSSKKKKKLSGVGHKDAVLSLAWNKELDHLLASGSVDETVILWDLHSCKLAQKMTQFSDKVQALQWHPKESNCLLSGCCDKYIRAFDCRSEDTYKSWKLDGEIESVSWDATCHQPYQCLASTDQGSIYCIDARKDKPLWNIKAHKLACTGISLSSKCPGCLVSVSEDKTVKIWDIAEGKPKLIKEKDPSLGVIHCVSPCVDEPFVFCFGGDNKQNNLKMMDIRQSKAVRKQFCHRIGLPTDEDGESEDDHMEVEDMSDEDDLENDYLGNSNNNGKKSKSKPMFEKKPRKKKKGGLLDRKKFK